MKAATSRSSASSLFHQTLPLSARNRLGHVPQLQPLFLAHLLQAAKRLQFASLPDFFVRFHFASTSHSSGIASSVLIAANGCRAELAGGRRKQ